MLRRRLAIQHPVDNDPDTRKHKISGFRNGRATYCEFELVDGSRGILCERRVNADIIAYLRQLYGVNLKQITFLSRARPRQKSSAAQQTRRRRQDADSHSGID